MAARPPSARKGLRNDLGENNCFLNVIIQSLWHVRACRVLISMGDHAVHHRCGGKPTNASAVLTNLSPCLLCELEQIFVLYQFAEQPVLDVDRVRLALGETFALGAMNDATETLETILDALHYDTFNRMLLLKRGKSGEDMTASVRQDAASIICEPQCVAHRLFQMNLMELKVCTACGHTAEPVMNTDFLYRVYAQELLDNARGEKGPGLKKGVTLEGVLQEEAQSQDVAGTCDSCEKGGQRALSRWILTLPMVFSISVIWSSSQVSKTDIKDCMELLSTQSQARADGKEMQQALDLGRIFRLDNSSGMTSLYKFRGLVCYYGRHYVGFFASRSVEDGVEKERWFLFDDTRVKRVGTWADVRLRIERGCYQPTLLFYERSGIEHENLEKIATEIHKWWEESADESEDSKTSDAIVKSPKKVEKNGVVLGAPHEVELGMSVQDELLAKMERSVRISQQQPLPPLVPKQVPTSPISVAPRAPASAPAVNESHAYNDEDLHLDLMHQAGQDMVSRLNGILSRNKSPATIAADGRELLRLAVSSSMRRSVSMRNYSVHRPAEKQLVVNPDDIFLDENDDEVEEDAVESKVSGTATLDNSAQDTPLPAASAPSQKSPTVQSFEVRLSASDGGLGLLLEEAVSNGDLSITAIAPSKSKFVVSGFEANGAGEQLPAEASGDIQVGDVLTSINGQVLENKKLVDVLEMLWTSSNPVQLNFNRLQPWACPRCTLLNETTESLCAACGHVISPQKSA